MRRTSKYASLSKFAVGHPLEVKKIENPTQEEIDYWHDKFVERLVKHFEMEKHKYLKDPDNTKIILV